MACWCSLRHQDISSHDIDYIEYVARSLTWRRILSTCVISMWMNDTKCKYMFMFPLKNLARKGLTIPPLHCLYVTKELKILQIRFQCRMFKFPQQFDVWFLLLFQRIPTFHVGLSVGTWWVDLPSLIARTHLQTQGSFCICAQPMRDDATL